jgi:integrase/recombinase XerC
VKEQLHRQKEEFLKMCEGMRGYSGLTIKSYSDALAQMIEFCEVVQEDDAIVLNITPLRLNISSLSAKSIALKLSATRSFVKYLQANEWKILLVGDEAIKVPKSLPKPLSHEHIMQALEYANPMEALIITLLYSMGLRISELSNLRLCDVSLQWCRVVGKGNKQRDVPMLSHVYEQLMTYQLQEPSLEYVFEQKEQKLSENSLRYSLTKAFSAVGLKVTPHQLRHSYATQLLNNGARIADVSELMGHASMATTQIYTKLGNAIKMEHYLHSHPLCVKSEEQ